ncbi:MAG TPA: zinc-dependent metalloprotease, partial [Flavisolibacter sp.]|nr:zinc-dependent metalloprotease [Flavisolibacter sp.]
QLFKTPKWLINPQITNLTGGNSMTTIGTIQDNVLGRLLSHNTLNKLLRFEAEDDAPYTAIEMLTDLRKMVWSELPARKPIDIYRRNLQKAFTERLVRAITPPETPLITLGGQGQGGAPAFTPNTDAMSVAKAQLRVLQSEIRAALPTTQDAASRAHLMDVNDRITAALDTGK